jgi:serine/threonine-protein kinase
MNNLIGQSIGRYHIVEQLGAGGMAYVYKAYDTRLERNVAIKVIRNDLFGNSVIERILKRFEREAKAMAHLSPIPTLLKCSITASMMIVPTW